MCVSANLINNLKAFLFNLSSSINLEFRISNIFCKSRFPNFFDSSTPFFSAISEFDNSCFKTSFPSLLISGSILENPLLDSLKKYKYFVKSFSANDGSTSIQFLTQLSSSYSLLSWKSLFSISYAKIRFFWNCKIQERANSGLNKLWKSKEAFL